MPTNIENPNIRPRGNINIRAVFPHHQPPQGRHRGARIPQIERDVTVRR